MPEEAECPDLLCLRPFFIPRIRRGKGTWLQASVNGIVFAAVVDYLIDHQIFVIRIARQGQKVVVKGQGRGETLVVRRQKALRTDLAIIRNPKIL